MPEQIIESFVKGNVECHWMTTRLSHLPELASAQLLSAPKRSKLQAVQTVNKDVIECKTKRDSWF